MRLKLKRRSVYVATIVAILAMIGGLAVAAISGIVFTPGTGNQNFGQISPGNTIYAQTGVTATLVLTSGYSGATGTCATSAAYTAGAANIVVAGSSAACTATGEWYDILSFSGVDVPAGASDTFYIGVNGGAALAPFTITSSTLQTPSTLNIYIDDGSTTGAPQITALTVTVSGS